MRRQGIPATDAAIVTAGTQATRWFGIALLACVKELGRQDAKGIGAAVSLRLVGVPAAILLRRRA